MPESANTFQIFLSYSRQDKAAGELLYKNFALQGLTVHIDIHDIAIGEDITQRIIELIQQSSHSIALLSEKSLQSTWVIWEIQQRKLLSQYNQSQLIPAYLDKTYLDDDYINKIQQETQTQLNKTLNEINQQNKNGTPTQHLDDKKNKLFDFKNSLSHVIKIIRDINSADLTADNYIQGFTQLFKAITGKSCLRNKIITPVRYDNADIVSRINTITDLASSFNLEEAAKRLIDLIRDCYPNNIDDLKVAIMVSAEVHGVGKLPEHEQFNIKLNVTTKLIDLTYKYYPEAA